jgi:hypothetical protein
LFGDEDCEHTNTGSHEVNRETKIRLTALENHYLYQILESRRSSIENGDVTINDIVAICNKHPEIRRVNSCVVRRAASDLGIGVEGEPQLNHRPRNTQLAVVLRLIIEELEMYACGETSRLAEAKKMLGMFGKQSQEQ